LEASIYDGSGLADVSPLIPGTNERRTLYLTNGETIWDFAGNVREHTNKSDTLDGIGYASTTYRTSDACNNAGNNILSYTGTDIDGKGNCVFQNNYTQIEI